MKRQRRKAPPKAPPRSAKQIWKSWYESKAPLVQFCLKFCGLLIFFYTLSFLPVYHRILDATLTINARLASALLDRLGENTQVTNATIWSMKYAITVLPACSAVEFLAFFCAMVIAFPSRISRKIPGILVGVVLLLALNQLRITSLYYIGAHFPKAFDTTHEDLWSVALIIGEIALCMAWIGWARESEKAQSDGVA
ncbi:MAG TPA: archaeosortase/exosortase family protein [Chthoniobacter sp.]|jgi:exosortase/archaeosortase family protein